MARPKPPPLYELPLEAVDGIGPRLAEVLAGMGIETVADLLEHYPHRYLDLSTVKEIGHIREGDEVTAVGEVKEVQKRRAARRGRMSILNIAIFDGTGYINGVWFNQDWIADKLPPGSTVALSGRALWRFNQLQIQNPYFDLLDEDQLSSGRRGRIIPVHTATAKLSAAAVR